MNRRYFQIILAICLVAVSCGDAEEINEPQAPNPNAPPEFIAEWGTEGSSNGQFSSPSKIDIDLNGNVYVADKGNHRVQKFGSDR